MIGIIVLPTINQTNSKRGQITYRLEIVVSTSCGIVVTYRKSTFNPLLLCLSAETFQKPCEMRVKVGNSVLK